MNETKINLDELDSVSGPTPDKTDDQIDETPIKEMPGVDNSTSGFQIPGDAVEPDLISPIDEDMCCMIYETIFGMASSILSKDSDIELPAKRAKSQGKLLAALFEKYQVGTNNMDAVLFMMGCAMDYQLIRSSKQDVL